MGGADRRGYAGAFVAALTALGARVFFKDALTRRMAAGVGLIAAGVLIIELGAAAH